MNPLLIPLLLLHLPAGAALATPCDADARRHARRLIQQGTQALRRERADRAAALFQKAYDICKLRPIAFNLALALAVANRPLRAARYLFRYLRGAPPGARDRLPPPLRRVLAQVAVVPAPKVPIAGATLWVDGLPARPEGGVLLLLAGTHALEVRSANRLLARRVVSLRGGETFSWRPQIPPVRRVSPPVRRAGPAGAAPPRTPQGALHERAARGPRRLHWAVFTATAAAAVASGVALAVLGAQVVRIHRAYDPTQPDADLRQRFERYKSATNAMVGVTSALGVTAALLAIFTRWRGSGARERPVTVTARATPWEATLVLQGTY